MAPCGVPSANLFLVEHLGCSATRGCSLLGRLDLMCPLKFWLRMLIPHKLSPARSISEAACGCGMVHKEEIAVLDLPTPALGTRKGVMAMFESIC